MRRMLLCASAGALLLTAAVATGPSAGADPIAEGTASAYGARLTIAGEDAIVEPQATATLPPGGDDSATTVDIPADPLAVSGTLNADAKAHAESDIESALAVVEQGVPGPYNVQGLASVEDAQVLVNVVDEEAQVSLIENIDLQAEAVAVCSAGAVQYSANSEIISLEVGGEDIPLNEPISELIDTINGILGDTGLDQVVDIERNVITELEDGIAVDALVVTVLAAAGEDPLGEIVFGHAEVSGTACGGSLPQEDPPTTPAPPTTTGRSLPQTGDDMPLLPLAAIAGAASLVGLAVRRRSAT